MESILLSAFFFKVFLKDLFGMSVYSVSLG